MASRRASELIEQLLARQQHPLILEKHTRLPYGWAIWLRARGLAPLPRPSPAEALVAHLSAQPRAPAQGRLPALGFVQAFRRLFWQGWDKAPHDQRWMRRGAAATSLLLHLLFALALLWVAVIRPPQTPEQGGEGERVQVEFVGQGSQDGGAPEPAVAAAEPAVAAAAAGVVRPSQTDAPTGSQPAAAAVSSQTAPPPPAIADAPVVPEAEPASSPLQATEVAEATSSFVVPPMTVPQRDVRAIAVPAAPAVRERTVALQPPAPTPVLPSVSLPEVAVPSSQPAPLEVREREVTAPLNAPAVSALRPAPRPDVAVPSRELTVRERQVEAPPAVQPPSMPARAAPSITAPALPQAGTAVRERSVTARPTPAATAAPPAAAAAAAPAVNSSAPRAAARPAPDTGNWATPARGDDWGAAARSRDGATAGTQTSAARGASQGLFNADGSVRVASPPGDGPGERGAPGGEKDGWSRDRIAQSGTWLKRPPYDYTPTSFDKYWVPNESLLAEWVRKGIKAIEIPLPGSGTKISCVISVLQFGGGCGLTDPNMQDQPAIARPPPDIPFKPEYQEE
ncbi:hypothetical protein RZA67_06140 [Stenotrophomonas sp. C3(2023)]|uniref:hypothetical protein n=1 Tax=Stenotrophomonas sp. C3(2023) TaxID=3080277 RepID=UPI00293C1B02|nr:hypothetical protein [Stenotrophomonas sp. C3(2023)]MDV3468313.1 hypothetical protein [Stenotrophomonas sp. C3(2023)]